MLNGKLGCYDHQYFCDVIYICKLFCLIPHPLRLIPLVAQISEIASEKNENHSTAFATNTGMDFASL